MTVEELHIKVDVESREFAEVRKSDDSPGVMLRSSEQAAAVVVDCPGPGGPKAVIESAPTGACVSLWQDDVPLLVLTPEGVSGFDLDASKDRAGGIAFTWSELAQVVKAFRESRPGKVPTPAVVHPEELG